MTGTESSSHSMPISIYTREDIQRHMYRDDVPRDPSRGIPKSCMSMVFSDRSRGGFTSHTLRIPQIIWRQDYHIFFSLPHFPALIIRFFKDPATIGYLAQDVDFIQCRALIFLLVTTHVRERILPPICSYYCSRSRSRSRSRSHTTSLYI